MKRPGHASHPGQNSVRFHLYIKQKYVLIFSKKSRKHKFRMGSLRNYCYTFNDSYVSNTIRSPDLGVAFVFRQKAEQKSPLC